MDSIGSKPVRFATINKILFVLFLALFAFCVFFSLPRMQAAVYDFLMRSYPALKDFGGGWNWKDLIFGVAVCGGISSLAAGFVSLFWGAIFERLSLHKKQNFFAFFIILCFCLSLVFACVTHGISWICALHQDAQDSFMDFFRLVGSNYDRPTTFSFYPPLSIILFHLLTLLGPDYVWDRTGSLKQNALALRSTLFGTQVLVLFLLSFVVLFYLVVRRFSRQKGLNHSLLIPCLFLSLPMLYALERGDIVLHAFAFTLLFLSYKDSEDRRMRELSFVFLAIAANIKYYPAIFGLLLLFERRWKESARCILYGVLIFLLSWLCFTNHNVQDIANAAVYTGSFMDSVGQTTLDTGHVMSVYGDGLNYSMRNYCCLFLQVLRTLLSGSMAFEQLWSSLHLTVLVTVCAVLCGVFACAFCTRTWQKYFALGATLILASGRASSSYILIFTIPALLEFIADEEKDYFSLALFCILMSLFALPVALLPGAVYLVTFSFLISSAAFLLLCINVFIKAWLALAGRYAFVRSFFQFVKFGLVGLSNTAISYAIYTVAVLAGAHYLVASVLAFVLSVLNSFLLNNRFVFKKAEGQQRNPLLALLKTYASYSITGLVLSNILLVLLVQKAGISEFVAPLITYAVTIPLNFLMNKFWAFRSTDTQSAAEQQDLAGQD